MWLQEKVQPQPGPLWGYWHVNGTTDLFSLAAAGQGFCSLVNQSLAEGHTCQEKVRHDALCISGRGARMFEGSFELLAAKPHGSGGTMRENWAGHQQHVLIQLIDPFYR